MENILDTMIIMAALCCTFMPLLVIAGMFELFAEKTRLGRRLWTRLERRLDIDEALPNIVTFRVDSHEVQVNLDRLSLDELETVSSWIEESISKK